MKIDRLDHRPFLVSGLAATALVFLAAVLLTLGTARVANAAVPADSITLQMHTVPSAEPGINLSIREKHLAGRTNFSSDKIVILLEPFGVPAAEAFDTSIPGFNMMDYLVGNGYDVFALDFRGFGGSDRPTAFAQPMMANPPQIKTADAAIDVETAMQYICAQRGVSKTNVLGWSWGAVVASMFAGQHPEQVERLVIYGGMHAFLLPSMTDPMTDPNTGQMKPLPAYQLATPSMSINHWNMQAMGMAPHTPEAEAELSRIFLGADPTSGTRNPPSIRRAMGPMADLYEVWSGRPVFDASLITAPTLIIRGDLDTFSDDPGFIDALTNAPIKRYVELPCATHWALYEEQSAPQLLNEIGRFLSAGRPGLRLNKGRALWSSYPDYSNRLLSVEYTVSNHGGGSGYNVQITGSSATSGVTLPVQTPFVAGDLPAGSTASFSLRYLVPAGVSRFTATVQASAEDGAGVPYQYPAP